MRLLTAFRSFFAVLTDAEVAEKVVQLMETPAGTAESLLPAPPPRSPATPAARSEALTLLSALQREARWVDFVKESLEGASDEQIGAVVRDIHRDCGELLERMFAIRPLFDEDEGSEVEVPAGFDPGRYRLTGNVQGEPPFRGKLGHHGWKATRVELPIWSGGADTAMTVSPAEVEL